MTRNDNLDSTFLDWAGLYNPVLSYPDWSIKDWTCAYHDGAFYLLYAGNTEKRTYRTSGGWGRGWNRLGISRSKDLIYWLPAGRE